MSDPIPSLAEIRDRASMRCLNPSPAMTDAIADRDALMAAVEGVLAVHQEVRVYNLTDECGHHHDEDAERIGRDEYGDAFCLDAFCLDSPTGDSVCSRCRLEDGDMETWPCPTYRAITAHVRIEEEVDRG